MFLCVPVQYFCVSVEYREFEFVLANACLHVGQMQICKCSLLLDKPCHCSAVINWAAETNLEKGSKTQSTLKRIQMLLIFR